MAIGQKKKVVLPGVIGNALEWYDFTIYAFFVPIIAKQFFPDKDPFLSLLATFGVFALGFLARPAGALLFGYIGDHEGRKKALIISMIMMSCPTFLMGLLPNYNTIGVAAPILLLMLRITQGLAVSGELTTATVFLVEHAQEKQRGLAGSFVMAGAFLGMVVSALFAAVISELLSDVELATWGWRIPFLIGGLIGIFGLLLRLRSIEPVVYQVSQEKREHHVQRTTLARHVSSLNSRLLCTGIFITSIMAVANYFLIAYFNTFLVESQHLPLRPVMIINSIALIMQMTVTVLTGYLSDRLGRKRVLSYGMIALGVLGYPVFWLLTQHSIGLALLGELLFAMAAGSLTGPIPTTLAEMFDVYHRNMGISISYNTALALFGGTAPLVAISLVAITNNVYSPVWYLMGFSIVGLLALKSLNHCPKKTENSCALKNI